MEPHPSRMLAVLDDARRARRGAARRSQRAIRRARRASVGRPGVQLLRRARSRRRAGRTRSKRATRCSRTDLGRPATDRPDRVRASRAADALSARLKVPTACRDAARLAARWLPRLASIERAAAGGDPRPAACGRCAAPARAPRACCSRAWIALDRRAPTHSRRDGARRRTSCGASRCATSPRAHGQRRCDLEGGSRARASVRCGNGSASGARTQRPMQPPVNAARRDTRRRASRPRRRASGA